MPTDNHTEPQIHHARSAWERTFDALPDLIAIIDSNNTITNANKAMAVHFLGARNYTIHPIKYQSRFWER